MKKCRQCGRENDNDSTFCKYCGENLITTQTDELKPGKIIGNRYTIGKVLGKGGFGITYKGSDMNLQRSVAIKEFFHTGSGRRGDTVIPPTSLTKKNYEGLKEKFRIEGRTLGKIKSENIVSIYDYLEENNTGYIVMEYIDGETLKEKIRREGKIKEEEIRIIVKQIINGLKKVHMKGLLHRDIKPENIIIEEGNAKLLDFGAAREYVLGQSLNMSQIVTPGYAPPEQYSERGKFGPELDIYALGATMYEMLLGTPPKNAIERMQSRDNLDSLTKVKCDDILKSIVKICMKLNSMERYKTVLEINKDLFVDPVSTKSIKTNKSKMVTKKSVSSQLIELVEIKRGNFIMGSNEMKDEGPVHEIEITYDFWMGKYTITFEEYDNFCEETGTKKPDDFSWGRGRQPVINVNWLDAIKFCNWLSSKEGYAIAYDTKGNLLDVNGNETTRTKNVKGYRLPTEAEWEYAAREIGEEDFEYSGSNNIDKVAWYWKNSGDHSLNGHWNLTAITTNHCKPHEVGEKSSNKLGLYDMSGNVWEWCQDFYDEQYYSKSPIKDPVNLIFSPFRITRGGYWSNYAEYCRVSYRYNYDPLFTQNSIGFRVVRTI